MKKQMILAVLACFIIAMVGVVSAKTIIAGKVYNADYSDVVADATVTVTCDHGGTPAVDTTTSSADGTYAVSFDEGSPGTAPYCDNGDTVTVEASKGSAYGVSSGVVDDDVIMDWDLAIVNVSIPEFGLLIGALTVFCAIAVFFVIRRK